MNILVVEAHPDDAYLSAGWHIEKLWPEQGHTVEILCVYNDKRRGEEARIYAEAVGASCKLLGLTESKMLSRGPIKRNKLLQGILADSEADLIVLPLGMQHPDHRTVRISAPSRGLTTKGYAYYLDTPYQTKLKNADELLSKVEGKEIRSICWPPKRKWRHSEIYKSQAKFFYYNPFQDWKLPEVIVQ